MAEEKKTIGQRIKWLRTEKMKMTQVAFADAINVSKQNLYKYENDIITNIPSDKIEAVAKLCSVSPAFIMGWDWDIVPMELSSMQAAVISAYKEADPDKQHAVNKFLGVWDNPPEHEDDPTIELHKTVFWDKYYSIDERGRKMVDMVLEQEFEHSKIEAPDLEYPSFEPKPISLKVAQESMEYTKE